MLIAQFEMSSLSLGLFILVLEFFYLHFFQSKGVLGEPTLSKRFRELNLSEFFEFVF